jgi:signal transduction histidine kinase
MTLRHRLLLVYVVVVLLSGLPAGLAVYELQRAYQMISEVPTWSGILLTVRKLRSNWPPPKDSDYDLTVELPPLLEFLAGSYEGDQVRDRAREIINDIRRRYDQWARLPDDQKEARAADVGNSLFQLEAVLEDETFKLNVMAASQAFRTRILLVMVAALTLLQILVIGSLLRRWLLDPMERLNRQVDALARDQAPAEGLVHSPLEMANLATALDRARLSLGALRQQLLDSERLSVIGQMAAQLAHNLRNPLASIRAAAQVTARQAGESPHLAQRMTDIMASVDRLNRWVMGLMEVARRDPTLTREVDVLPTVHNAIQAVAEEALAKEMPVDLQAPLEGLVCAHDPATLEHALVAMLVNAVEASPLGGRLGIVVARVADQGRGPLCRISVTDQGCGLPADAPGRIFEFAYSTKQKGMGLGLALARQSLTRQGGSISAFNNADRGATVFVELPIHREVAADRPAGPARLEQPVPGAEHQ